MNPVQTCADCFQLPKTGGGVGRGGTVTFPSFPCSFSSGGKFDCREELATSFCHSVLGATDRRKLALLGAGAQNLRLSWDPLGCFGSFFGASGPQSSRVTRVPSHREGCVKDTFPLDVTSDQEAGDPLLAAVPTDRQAGSLLVPGRRFRLIFLPGSVRPVPVASPAPTRIMPLIQGLDLDIPGAGWNGGRRGRSHGRPSADQPLFLFLRSFTCGPSDR